MAQLVSSRHLANERALERIGFHVSTWDQMKWFVEFSKKDIHTLNEADFHTLQQEIVAVAWKARGYWVQALPARQQVVTLQASIAEAFSDLIEHENLQYGPVTSMHSIDIVHFDDEDEKGNTTWQSGTIYHADIQGETDSVLKDHLIVFLFELLRSHALSLRRCPHCSKIFLQLRQHAKYCSRECQSVATMRMKRLNKAGSNRHSRRKQNGTQKRKG